VNRMCVCVFALWSFQIMMDAHTTNNTCHSLNFFKQQSFSSSSCFILWDNRIPLNLVVCEEDDDDSSATAKQSSFTDTNSAKEGM
jgi:hypothetical protein